MAISEFGALTREFYIAEIGTWENMAVSEFGGILGGDITRFYCTVGNSLTSLIMSHSLDDVRLYAACNTVI